MKIIESILEPIIEYFVSFTHNTDEGYVEMEIGIPKGWVFDENEKIKCEILNENENGKLIKISPKNNNIVIDDLIAFVQIIIETNGKIAEKEKQFTDRMAEMKGVLEKEAKKFYEELDELRLNSFNNLNADFERSLHEEKKTKKERKSKNVVLTFSNETYVPPKVNANSIPQ